MAEGKKNSTTTSSTSGAGASGASLGALGASGLLPPLPSQVDVAIRFRETSSVAVWALWAHLAIKVNFAMIMIENGHGSILRVVFSTFFLQACQVTCRNFELDKNFCNLEGQQYGH